MTPTDPQPKPAQADATTEQRPLISQKANNVTLNTTSVVSKIGLYARVTFIDLWIMAISTCTSISVLIHRISGTATTLVFMISVLVITIPIFVIANNKRIKELDSNPSLVDDIFLKKYLRSNLFLAIFATAISLFSVIYSLLSIVLLSSSGSASDKAKTLVSALVYAVGFGGILAFSWKQHARTTK